MDTRNVMCAFIHNLVIEALVGLAARALYANCSRLVRVDRMTLALTHTACLGMKGCSTLLGNSGHESKLDP